MAHHPGSRRSLSRRSFLRASLLAGAGLGLAACGPAARPSPTTAPKPAEGLAAADKVAGGGSSTTLKLVSWNFEPQEVEANVRRFMDENPDLQVEHSPIERQFYNEKMVALFTSQTPMDVVYVNDVDFAAWVEAGWLLPIDGMSGLDEVNRDIYPFNLEALRYGDKQYGLPYSGDIRVQMYDEKVLKAAGLEAPPATLDQLKNAALGVKKAGLAEYPILMGHKSDPDGLSEWWSMVFASGGSLFDGDLNPLYPDKDPTALAALEWMVQAMHDWKILDPRGIELDIPQVRDAFSSGQGVFHFNNRAAMVRVNEPRFSKRPGQIRMARFPGLTEAGKGPMGFTRLYGMSVTTKDRAAAWRLLYYLGGKDRNGQYSAPKSWFLKVGAGYAVAPLDTDPDVINTTQGWGDIKLMADQYKMARTRQNIKEPWYNDWDRYTQQQVQEALLRKITPREALANSARKTDELRKEWRA
jgi:multiple sugar transport system substrate-binding protein